VIEHTHQSDSHTVILLILIFRLDFHCFRVTNDAVARRASNIAYFTKNFSQILYIRISQAQEIGIPGDAVTLASPYEKEACTFQDKAISIRGNTQPVEKALHAIVCEQQIKCFIVCSCPIAQTFEDGVRHILLFSLRHTVASR
jgi:hypothetical protein